MTKPTEHNDEANQFPWGFSNYAKETIKEYHQLDNQGKQLIRFHIIEEIDNYQSLLETFDEMDE
jgi:hypothetical protein